MIWHVCLVKKKGIVMKIVNGVPGDSIMHTLTKACTVSRMEYKPVLLEINDIMILVAENANRDQIYQEYQEKLNFKFEIEKLKRQRQQ